MTQHSSDVQSVASGKNDVVTTSFAADHVLFNVVELTFTEKSQKTHVQLLIFVKAPQKIILHNFCHDVIKSQTCRKARRRNQAEDDN